MCNVCPGTLPNITRNALVNCTELVTYDLIKEAILRHKLMSGKSRPQGLLHTHSISEKWLLIGQIYTPINLLNS